MAEAEIDRLPVDVLALILSFLSSFTDLARATEVCKAWKLGVDMAIGKRRSLSFDGWKVDDQSAARVVSLAYSLKELDIARSRWECTITDEGLAKISMAKCVPNLTSISLWGMAGITDAGVIQLVSKAASLQELNIGGTLVTDESLYAIANDCPNLNKIVLWSCRHITESGLLALVTQCLKLKAINLWGTKVPDDCFTRLLAASPALQIKPPINLGAHPLLQVVQMPIA